MAKTKTHHENEIVKVIEENNIFAMGDIFAYYAGIKKSRFYQLNLEKSERIVKAIENNKTRTKQTLKRKWFASDNPTLQIALYKILGSDEERKKLLTSYHEVEQNISTKIDIKLTETLKLESLSEEEKKLVEQIAIKQISSMSGVSEN